jgi:hypothetical protein
VSPPGPRPTRAGSLWTPSFARAYGSPWDLVAAATTPYVRVRGTQRRRAGRWALFPQPLRPCALPLSLDMRADIDGHTLAPGDGTPAQAPFLGGHSGMRARGLNLPEGLAFRCAQTRTVGRCNNKTAARVGPSAVVLPILTLSG